MSSQERVRGRKSILRLAGRKVEIATGVVLALLWEARASADAAAGNHEALFDANATPVLLAGEAALIQAIDRGDDATVSLDALRGILTPEELVRLGLHPRDFNALLDSNPPAAIRKLDGAFRAKLKLVAAHGTKLALADLPGGHDAGDVSLAGSGGGGGNGILYALGGLLGAGGIGAAAAAGGGASTAAPVAAPPGNAAPVSASDSVATAEDTAVTFDVRTNDSDANGDPLSVTAINGAAIAPGATVATTGGTVTLGSDGRLTFTPTPNFNGPASFTYTIGDGKGGASTATVNLAVAPVNDAPVNAGPAATAANAATAVIISGLSIADVDADGTPLSTTLSVGHGLLFAATVPGGATISGTGGGAGAITLTGTVAQINATLGAITYVGTSGFGGTDSLTMTTSDGAAADTDTFPITVTAVQSASSRMAISPAARSSSTSTATAGSMPASPWRRPTRRAISASRPTRRARSSLSAAPVPIPAFPI